REKLTDLLAGFTLADRTMLACKVDERRTEDALNEVCIRSHNLRVLTLTLKLNCKTYRFRADGLIFATPTGSTGYAYSCGGRELSIKSKKYVVVAIAPYRREFLPLIVSNPTISRIIVETHGKADVIIDGQFLHELKNGSRVIVWKSEREAKFMEV
ncbi:MAG: NAD(+)/NADH kinase, partial [Thaumarchaeota archaeon]|nr:NAD(+)/NADH kinase [Nitrososphaerota archaeon]